MDRHCNVGPSGLVLSLLIAPDLTVGAIEYRRLCAYVLKQASPRSPTYGRAAEAPYWRHHFESRCFAFAGETLLQRRHQVHDLAFLALRNLDFNHVLVLLALCLNQLQQFRGLLIFQGF